MNDLLGAIDLSAEYLNSFRINFYLLSMCVFSMFDGNIVLV